MVPKRPEMRSGDLAIRIQAVEKRGPRRLIALCGPPASGKSTLSEELAALIPDSCVVPMDGFHLDNRLLELRGLLPRKGAPETFDVRGFKHLIERLKTEDEVIFPVFDRALDRAIAGAGVVARQTETVVVEGNYLLLDAPGWRDLAELWDLSISLDVAEPVLRKRLLQRWRDHGLSEAEAEKRTEENDLPNARYVAANLMSPDLTVQSPE